MREILFRGKTQDRTWVEGSYHQNLCGFHEIVTENKEKAFSVITYQVIPETVGQFTGLTDKNGNKIFEGDIVVTRYPEGDICVIGDVQFDSGVFGVEWTNHKKSKSMVGSWWQNHNLRRFDDDIINHIEVIGNIHDNPELLEVNNE